MASLPPFFCFLPLGLCWCCVDGLLLHYISDACMPIAAMGNIWGLESLSWLPSFCFVEELVRLEWGCLAAIGFRDTITCIGECTLFIEF